MKSVISPWIFGAFLALLPSLNLQALNPEVLDKPMAQPLYFVPNRGQIADLQGRLQPDIRYKLAQKGVQLFIRPDGISYQLQYREGDMLAQLWPDNPFKPAETPKLTVFRVDMQLLGANPLAQAEEEEGLAYYENYYLGHCPQGITNVPTYQRIRFKEVYPGIDWVLYVQGEQLKYDFELKPGADAQQIRLHYKGIEGLALEGDGQVRIQTALGYIEEKAPQSFQGSKGVATRFVLKDGHTLGFELAPYDKGQALRLDPILEWATFYGGAGDEWIRRIRNDNNFIYVVGNTTSSAGIASTTGVQQTVLGGGEDGFLGRWNFNGQRIWTTYYGGTQSDRLNSVALNPAGEIWVVGRSTSTGMATGIQTSNFSAPSEGSALIVKFNANGFRLWARYYGGAQEDRALDVLIDPVSSEAWVCGLSHSTNNISLNTSAARSSFQGGNDAFVARFSNAGIQVWGAYYGGSSFESAHALALSGNNLYVTGVTYGGNFPVTAGTGPRGNGDATLIRLDRNGTGDILESILWGSTGEDVLNVIEVQGSQVYALGYTNSASGINQGTIFQPSTGGGEDAMILRFPTGALNPSNVIAGYYGGSGFDRGFALHVDATGVYIGGVGSIPGTANGHFPTGGAGRTGFIAKLNLNLTTQFWWTRAAGSFFDMGVTSLSGTSDALFSSSLLTGSVAAANVGVTAQSWQAQVNGAYEGYLARFSKADFALRPDSSFRSYTFCPDANIRVPLRVFGAFNAGNNFTAVLSNSAGSFATGTVTLGSSTTTQLDLVIPPGTANGTNYQIRFSSSSPASANLYTLGGLQINQNCISLQPNSSGYCRDQPLVASLPRFIAPPSPSYTWNISGIQTSETEAFSIRQLGAAYGNSLTAAVTVTIPGGTLIRQALASPRPIYEDEPYIEDLNYQICQSGGSVSLQVRSLNNQPCPSCPMQLLDSAGNIVQTWTGLPQNIAVSQPGIYSARIVGCQTSNAVGVRQVNLGSFIQILPGDTVCGGTTASLSVVANCSNCTYLWNTGATTAQINHLATTNSALFSVTVSESPSPGSCQEFIQRTLFARAPAFDSVRMLPVANTEGLVNLDSLLGFIMPLSSEALTRSYDDGGNRVSGSLATGFFFDVRGLSPGSYPLNVRVAENGCLAQQSTQLQILAPPSLGGLQPSYCRGIGPVAVQRDPAYTHGFQSFASAFRQLERQRMILEVQPYNGSPIQNSPNTVSENWVFNPLQIPANQAQVRIVYRTLINDIDPFSGTVVRTRSYIVGSRLVNLNIVDNAQALILDRSTQYCERNEFVQIRLQPANDSGQFVIQQIVSPSNSSVLRTVSYTPNSLGQVFFNTAALDIDNTDSYYRMIYTYNNNGCGAADSLVFFLSEPVDSSFTPSFNAATLRYCASIGEVNLLPATPGGVFTLDGLGLADGIFRPTQLGVGTYLLRYDVSNSAGCFYHSQAIYTVDSLPVLSLAALPSSFCENSGAYTVNPSSFALPLGGQLSIWRRGDSSLVGNLVANNVGLPYTFSPALTNVNLAGEDLVVRYQFVDGNGCSAKAVRNLRLWPKPPMTINLPVGTTTLCQGQPARPLSPIPVGLLSSSSANGNLNPSLGIYTPTTQVANDLITYTYQDPVTGCGDTLFRTISVVSPASLPTISFSGSLLPTYCQDSFLQTTLSVSMSGGTLDPARGSFVTSTQVAAWQTNPGATSATFYPVNSGLGRVYVFYNYTHSGAGSCTVTLVDSTLVRARPNARIFFQGVPAGAPNSQSQVCQRQGDSLNLIAADLRFPPVAMGSFSFSGTGVQGNRLSIDSAQTLNVTLAYADVFGCTDTVLQTMTVLPNPRPELSGLDSSYCLNSPIDTILGLPLGGRWTTSPSDYIFDSPNATLFLPRGPFGNLGSALVDVQYQVTYTNLCVNQIQTQVSVNLPPILQITSLFNGQLICQNEPPISLQATVNGQAVVSGGLFFENQAGGVFNNLFYPSAALLGRTVFFQYTDSLSGCTDTTQVSVTILRKPDAALMPLSPGFNGIYCVDAPLDSFQDQSTVYNPGAGTYQFLSSSANPQTFVTASQSNRGLFWPAAAGIGSHQLRLVLTDAAGCRDTASVPVTVVGLPQGVGILPFDTMLCTNESRTEVRGIPIGGGNFRILNQQGQLLQGPVTGSAFDIRPSTLNRGYYQLVYAHTNSSGCTNYDTTNFAIHEPPGVNYAQLSFCEGDTIFVENRSTYPNPLNAADTTRFSYWRYQGLLRPSTSSRLALFGEPAGWGFMELVTESGAGCRDTLSSNRSNSSGQIGDTIFVFGRPRIRFAEEGGCQGQAISLIPDSTGLRSQVNGLAFDRITQVRWQLGTGDSIVWNNPTGTAVLPALQYTYSQPGIYYPRLRITNNGFCSQEDSIRLVISPTFNPVQVPYSQDFEASDAQWFTGSLADAQNNLWQWGLLQGTRIPAWQGNNWSTGGGQAYTAGRAAWVYTPCFDLRQSRRPMLKFDYFADLYPFDGVALEYYETANNRWRTLGERGKGLNWYNNEDNLFGLLNFKPLAPWSSLEGWTGLSFDWETARYRLDLLKGQQFVRLRFALGTLDNVPNNAALEGFALDNFWLGERRRSVLVEHFANVFYPDMDTVNYQLYNHIGSAYNGQDVFLLQFHTNQSSLDDPIYQLNTADHSARRFYYGAEDAKAILNGNAYYGPSERIAQNNLDSLMLQDPRFAISIQPIRITAGVLELNARLEAVSAQPSEEYVLYAAVVEDSIFENGLTLYSVMRKLLPNHSAYRYTQSWLPGQPVQINETWTIDNNAYNPAKLQGLVFLQIDSSKEVLQVAATRNINFFPGLPTGLQAQESPELDAQIEQLFSFKVYPNPAKTYVFAELNQAFERPLQWALYDLQGRVLQQADLPAHTAQWLIKLDQLASGMYILHLRDSQTGASAQRQIIIQD